MATTADPVKNPTWVKLKSAWKKNEVGKKLVIEDPIQAKALIDSDIAEACEDPTADILTEAGTAFDAKLKAYGTEIASEVVKKMTAGSGKRPQISSHDNELDEPMLGVKSGVEFFRDLASAHYGKGDVREVAHKKIYGEGGYEKKMLARCKATGQNEAIDSEGGLFVIQEIAADVETTTAQLSNIRDRCRQITMAGNSYRIRARVDKDHTKSVAGGIQVYRTGEAQALTATKATFEWIDLKPTKQTGACYITDEMMEDAPAFASLFPGYFAEAMASADEQDALISDGAGQPLGAFHPNNPSRITIPKDAGQVAQTLTLSNIFNMRKAAYGYKNMVWVATQDIIPQLATFVIGTVPVFMPSVREDIGDTLLGRPILWTEWAETLGTQGDIRLFNGQEYACGNRGGMNSATSMHVRFLQGEQVMKFWRRNDGQPLWRAPLTPIKGSQRSPFVDLATRA